VDPGGLDGDLRIVRVLRPQLQQQRQRLFQLATLAEGDRAGEPLVRAHRIGFSMVVQSIATPSGIVTSMSATASKP
jgi:hypothetical protein